MGIEADVMPFRVDSVNKPTAWGLSIEAMRLSLLEQSEFVGGSQSADTAVRFQVTDSILPSLLLPRLPLERTRLQVARPLHPRGENDVWPPESAVNSDDDGPRIPTALLWRGLSESQQRPWRWKSPDGASVSKTSASLIAQCISESLRSGPAKRSDQVVVVIPNGLLMASQQLLLDECYQAGLNVSLLWRPVAAAIAWCQQFAETIESPDRLTDGDISKGRLLSLHLGMDEIELTVLDLVQRTQNICTCILPARQRPRREKERMASFGMNYVLECARRFVKNPTVAANTVWQRLCGSERTRQFLKEAQEKPDSLLGEMLRSRESSPAVAGRSSIPWYPQLRPGTSFDGWLRSQAVDFSSIVGVVLSGELAALLVSQNLPLWKHCLQMLGCTSIPPRFLLDDSTPGDSGILARGAAIHSHKLINGLPSYLDTLPRIQTALSENGEPKWFDLLSSNDEYVDGGRLWKRPEPLAGMHLAKDQSQVELLLSHEEFSTVRKVAVTFKEPADRNIPVVLEVSIQPAQGNAKVEVVPQVADAIFHRLPMEWKVMRDVELTAEEWINSQPTAFPPLMPRAPSDNNWQSAKILIRRFLGHEREESLFDQSTKVNLKDIASALGKKDQNPVAQPNEEATGTAFSSEGTLARRDDQLVNLFVNHVLNQLSSGDLSDRIPLDEVAVRALGYTSTADETFQKYLLKRISRVGRSLQTAELMACGRCLRSPDAIARFASASLARLNETPDRVNNWLRALGEILRYRYDATKDIDSTICLALLERILVVFERERTNRSFDQIFRNSCICIVCLLRRRMFDPDFLDLDTPAQIRVRQAFVQAIEDVTRLRRTAGGTINISAALQDMLACIDKRGPSLLQAGKSMRAMVDDDD
jgi:hypothetical protein